MIPGQSGKFQIATFTHSVGPVWVSKTLIIPRAGDTDEMKGLLCYTLVSALLLAVVHSQVACKQTLDEIFFTMLTVQTGPSGRSGVSGWHALEQVVGMVRGPGAGPSQHQPQWLTVGLSSSQDQDLDWGIWSLWSLGMLSTTRCKERSIAMLC